MPGSGRARVARSSGGRCMSDSTSPPFSQPTDADVADCSGTNATRLISSGDSCSGKKKGRGPTRGLSLAKKLQRGDPIEIVISDGRLVGNTSGDLINEAGIVIRDLAPLHIRTWKNVPLEDKNKMWEILREKFRLPNDDEAKESVLQQLSTHRRNYRSKLHVEYFKPHGSIEGALQHCPPLLSEDRWRNLCTVFASAEFQKLSAINSNNRAQQTILHCAGSKGYHRREYEMRNKDTGERPSMTKLWTATHFNDKKDKWVNEAAESVHNQVILKKQQSELEGVEITDDDAFLEVLGHRSGYIRGQGAGPKPKLSSLGAIQKEKEAERDRQVAEARKEADEARKEADRARREADEARKEAAALKERMTQLDGKLDAMMNLLLQQRTSL